MKCNQSPIDRVIRCVVGVILIAAGLFSVRGLFGVVLDALGALLIFSGSIGFCHVYKVLHINTARKA